MSLCTKLVTALAAAGTVFAPIAPVAAADGDTVEAAPPKDAEAGQPQTQTVTLDAQSWRDMQCLSLLFYSLNDPKKTEDAKLHGALMLNIGYHLGMVNERSPEISPPNLILLAIEKTFTKDGVPEEVTKYCQTANGVVADEVEAIDTVIAKAAASVNAQKKAAAEAEAR